MITWIKIQHIKLHLIQEAKREQVQITNFSYCDLNNCCDASLTGNQVSVTQDQLEGIRPFKLTEPSKSTVTQTEVDSPSRTQTHSRLLEHLHGPYSIPQDSSIHAYACRGVAHRAQLLQEEEHLCLYRTGQPGMTQDASHRCTDNPQPK